MFSFNRLSKIFLSVALGLVILIVVLMAAHVYLGDRHFDSGRNYFPPVSQFLAPDADEFSVALASDTATNNLVLEKVVRTIRKSDEKYSFVLYLGDFVKDNWADFHWLLWEIRPHLRNMPFYAIPGNHDVVRRHKIDKSFYRSIMGPEYYWFGYGDVLFIATDSAGDSMDDAQLKWLDDTLTKIRPLFKFCVIYGHRPPMNPVSPAGQTIDHMMDAQSAAKFKEIVSRHKIDAMFFGHVHFFSDNRFAGIPLYTLPPAGQTPNAEEKRFGYVSLTFDRNGIKKVEPKYIEFTGRTAEHREAWLINNIINYKTRRSVNILAALAALFGIAGLCAAFTRRRQ